MHRMKGRIQALIGEFGAIALVTYLAIFAAVLAGFAIAIATGFEVDDVAEGTGTLAAAWLATKLTQPLRIGATVVLTPLIAGVVRRIRPPRDPA